MSARTRWLGPAFAVAILGVALVALQRELRAFRYHDVTRALAAMPSECIVAALALTALSYVVLIGYDALALRYAGRRLPARRIALSSFASYAISHTLGFPLITGGAVRVRFWSLWGLSTGEIAQAASFAGATFLLGMVQMVGLVLVLQPDEANALLRSLLDVSLPMRPVGVLFLLTVVAYVTWAVVRGKRPPAPHDRRAVDRVDELQTESPVPAEPPGEVAAMATPALAAPVVAPSTRGPDALRFGGWAFPVPAPGLAVAQLLLAAVDWVVAAAVLFVLLPRSGDAVVPFLPFVGAFLLAQLAGVVSHVPGGIGVFDTLIVVLLRRWEPNAAAVVAALVGYRAIYYVLPFIGAVVMVALHETRAATARFAGGVVRGTRIAGRLAPRVVPIALSFATFAAGVVLLVSGATPSVHSRVAVLDRAVPLGVIEISHFVGSLAGGALLVLAWALRRRLDAAWGLATIALVVGIVSSVFKGLDFEEAFVLLVVLTLLLPARPAFYRRAALTNEPFTPGWLLAVAVVIAVTAWLGLFAYKHVEYSSELFWQFEARGDAPRFLRASVGVTIGLLVFALLRLLRHAAADPAPPTEAELARASIVIARAPATEANRALLGDKALLFSESGRSFLMYGIAGRSWVALGDPVGPAEEHSELAWRFKEAADEHGGWTVFYQVGVDHLPLYIDLGLTLLKLGEEARVPLDRFSLDGAARKGMRRIVNAAEKGGVRLEIVEPAGVPALMPDLQRISDDWLMRRSAREKGFSLGFFDARYLSHFPIAVVHACGPDGERPVAFANLWCGADRCELSVDLMRYSIDAPESVMEYLFIQLMLWGKAQGYAEFNLGMAPLSGLENRNLAPLWSRAGALLYRHGEHFYNFRGLRGYKEKFDPVWEPKYLASPGGLVLPRVVANVTTLISGGLRGVVAR